MNHFKATLFTDNVKLGEVNLLGKFETEDIADNSIIKFISNVYCHYHPEKYHWIKNKNIWSNGFDTIKVEPCP